MDRTMADLYTLIEGRISIMPVYQEKIRALAIAKLAVLEELRQEAGQAAGPLLDVYSSLDGERQELREQLVFEAALELGIELGRLGLKA